MKRLKVIPKSHQSIGLSVEKQANLKKLAEYLLALPKDYKHFKMSVFFEHEHVRRTPNQVNSLIEQDCHTCGTVACALGHGPLAGIPAYEVDWERYALRVFINNNREFSWCFSGCWMAIDNTPQGAAKRIMYMLEHGVPLKYNYTTSYYEVSLVREIYDYDE